MREETLLVPSHDGVKIRVTLTRGETDNLIVHLPFFAGNHRCTVPYLAARALPGQCGASFATIDPFVALEGYRSLSDPDLTLATHVRDLQTVITFLKEERGVGLGAVHGLAHSLSAYPMVVAGADLSVGLTSLILWEGSDPFDPVSTVIHHWGLQKEGDLYFSRLGMGMVMSGSYLRSIEGFRLTDYTSGWNTPSLIVAAENNFLIEAARAYRRHLRPGRLRVIQGSDHFFTADPRWFRDLCDRTSEWVQDGYLEI